MPVLKQDRSVRRRHFLDLLFIGIPFVGALVLGVATSWSLGAGVAALLLGLAGLYRQERRCRSLRCPSCGVVLRRAAGEPGAPITFACSACGTEWDTGFRESTD